MSFHHRLNECKRLELSGVSIQRSNLLKLGVEIDS